MSEINELKMLIQKFVKERNWDSHHSPKNLTMSISIEAAELMEIFQWDDNDNSNLKGLNDKFTIDRVRDELADVLIYSLSLANWMNFDVAEIVREKMKRNENTYLLAGKIVENLTPQAQKLQTPCLTPEKTSF